MYDLRGYVCAAVLVGATSWRLLKRAERGSLRDGEAWDRSHLSAAWRELWMRTARGSIERLPDPARHPECWFKII